MVTLQKIKSVGQGKRILGLLGNNGFMVVIKSLGSLSLLIVFCSILQAETIPNFPVLCEAIKKAENSTKYPYGILKHYKHTTPRQACLNTCAHKFRDWNKTDKRQTYLEYLSTKYCPINSDTDNGTNQFWQSNVNYHLKAIKESGI